MFPRTTAESRRHDLYTGLSEILGADQADTLMAYLPSQESTEVATKADLDDLEVRLGGRIDEMGQHIDAVGQRIDAVGQRIDRMVLAMVAGLVAIIATLIAQSFI